MEEITKLINKINLIKSKKFDDIYSVDEVEINSDQLNYSKRITLLKKVLSSNYIIKNGYKYKFREKVFKKLHLITFSITALLISLIYFGLIEVTLSSFLIYTLGILFSIPITSSVNRYKDRMLKENKILKPYYDLYGNEMQTKEYIQMDLKEMSKRIENIQTTLDAIENDKQYIDELDRLLSVLTYLRDNINTENVQKTKEKMTQSINDELKRLATINEKEKRKILSR